MQQSQFIANYLTVKIDSTAHKGTGSPQGDGPPGTVGSIEVYLVEETKVVVIEIYQLGGLDVGTVPIFKMHNVGTVPTFKMHNVGTVPTFKMHNIGTVPIFKMHNLGTVPTFKMHNIGTPIFL